MNKVLLVLVGAVGIGVGLGVAFLMPSLETREAVQASANIAFKEELDGEAEESEEEVGVVLYDVIRVIDGDTIAISMNGESETLRLIGIDTPETVDTRTDVQCFGKEASDKAKALLTGRKVSLEMDEEEGERDKYDRLLAYVYRDDGLFFNKYMIEEGFAHEYTYDDAYKYQKEFKAAEAAAKAGKKGLWAPNVCLPVETAAPKSAASATQPPSSPQPAPQTEAQQTQPLPQSQSETVPTSQPTPEPEPEPQPQPQINTSNYTCSSNTYNCSDFTTHDEAQAVYEACGGVDNDIHRLDSNKDGEACESLP